MSLDYALYHWMHSIAGRTPLADTSIIFLAVYLPLVMGVVTIGYVIVSNHPRTEKIITLITALIAIIVSRYVITAGIRLLVERVRPSSLPDANALFHANGSSFPSAHATVLFASGTILYAYNKKAGVVFYCMSTIVCIARVAAGVHYPSDILAGTFVGIIVGVLVLFYITPKLRHYHA